MNNRIARVLLGSFALTLAGISSAIADDEPSACTEPGLPLLSDAGGDVDFQLLPSGLPVDMLDLQSLSVSQPPQDDGVNRLVFTLKTAALAQTLPRQAWFATFMSADKRAHGVRMVVGEDGAVAFQTYLVLVDTDGNITEGRYPETGSVAPAGEGSSYDADGTIRIVADAETLGLRKGTGKLSGFNAGSLQQVPTGDTLTPSGDLLALIADGMPDDMVRSGAFEVGEDCSATTKAASGSYGGALGLGGLLPLLLLAFKRRRAVAL